MEFRRVLFRSCSHMAMIRKGKILIACNPREAIQEISNSVWEATISPDQVSELKRLHNVVSTQMTGAGSRVRVISETRPGEQFTSVSPALEDFYLSYVTRN